MLFKIGGGNLQLPKLIGAFILVAALLMFVKAGAGMFDSWDAIKDTQACFEKVGTDPAYSSISECKDMASGLGLYVKAKQPRLTFRQFWSALLEPIANLFFWAVIFLIGILFYRTGDIVIPIEQSIKDVPDTKPVKKK